jgi:hypothetical protein
MISLERVYAPSGQLQQNLPMLKMVGRSAVLNHDWFIAFQNHRAKLQNITINAQQIWDDYIASENAKAKQRSQIYQDFDYYIRGTQVVIDPFTGSTREVVDGGSVWFSRDGRVLVNPDPAFDPNNNVVGTWQAGTPV